MPRGLATNVPEEDVDDFLDFIRCEVNSHLVIITPDVAWKFEKRPPESSNVLGDDVHIEDRR